MNAQFQLDANSVAFFERRLQYIDPLPVFKDKGLLTAGLIFDVRRDVDPGAETYGYRLFETLGEATDVDPYATDVPVVGVEGKQFSSNIAETRMKIVYSADEIEKINSAKENDAFDLIAAKREGIQRLIAEYHNKRFWLGNSNLGINGVLSDSNVANASVANGAGGQATWASKTGQEILDDLNEAVGAIITNTLGVRRPDTLILDATKFHVFNTTLIADGTDETVGTAFRKQHADIRVEMAPEILGAFTGGANGFVMLNSRPEVIRLVAPVVYEEAPIFVSGFVYQQEAKGRNGGAEIRFPKAIVKRYGI